MRASGAAGGAKGFAEPCMAEYDLDGWKIPDLTDRREFSFHATSSKTT
jgi:4-hydroxyphenylacetate 3-monooxygenase